MSGGCFVLFSLFSSWFLGECDGYMLPVFLDCLAGVFKGIPGGGGGGLEYWDEWGKEGW